jgi:tetratricopeptide (TPR) repeat protein
VSEKRDGTADDSGAGGGKRPASKSAAPSGEPPVTSDTIKVSKVVRKPPPPLEAGDILGARYEIEACVGDGGSGFVFRAIDRVLGQQVALKVLHPDLASDWSWIKRFKREVKVAREIQHPNVLRVFDLGHADLHWFVTMEYAAGGSLRQVLDARSGMVRPLKNVPPSDFAARFGDAKAVCAGLAAIHSVGIVHRDVTPANVLRMHDDRLVITDFGLAIKAQETTTFHGGTPRYMAPEVHQRKPATQRSDVWQLGYLLHEIIFQRHPDWTSGDRVMLKSPAHALSTPTEVAIAELCAECLAQNPDARPRDAVEVAGRLAAAQYAKPFGPVTRIWRRAGRTIRTHRLRTFAVLTVLLVVIAAGVVAVRARKRLSTCDAAVARADRVWAPYEGAAREKLLSTGRPHAGDVLSLLNRVVREHLERWKDEYRRGCNGSPAVRECLDEDLAHVDAIQSMFSATDFGEQVVDAIPPAIASLRPPSRCRIAKETDVRPRPLSGPLAVIEKINSLREQLLAASPFIEGWPYRAARYPVEPLANAARDTGFCPLIAEALLAEANASGYAVAGTTSRTKLEQALWKAEECGYDRIVATAAAELVFVDRFENEAVSNRWATMADTVLKRMGGDARLEAWLADNRATAAKERGHLSEAIAGYRLALRLKEFEAGPNHLEVGYSLANLSDALKEAGQLGEALAVSDRALSILTDWLGPDHVELGGIINNRGDLLVAMHRLPEAEEMYRRSAALFRSAKDFRLYYPVGGHGLALLVEGRVDEAIPLLEEAVSAHIEDNLFAASVKFALAQALVRAGRNAQRALALAVAARDIYHRNGNFARREAEVADWISDQTRSRQTPSTRRL